MTIDELIAVAEYKSKNIKAHISPSTFEQMADALIAYKEIITELKAKDSIKKTFAKAKSDMISEELGFKKKE